MNTTQQILLFASALMTALVAGLLYSYMVSVNPGLSKLPDAGYLAAMQSINREIQNPLFFATFMGALLLLPVTAWYSFGHAPRPEFYLLLAAAFLYVVGVFGITAAGNIPLNDQLDKMDLTRAIPPDFRREFETSWNRFHAWRTGFSVASLSLILIALIRKN